MKQHMNYTMLCDFYELTMGNGYFQTEYANRICYFDVFFRTVPDGGGFAIAAGLEQVIDYIQNLRFDEEDIEFLRSKGVFCEGFLDYLRQFRFTGDIWAVPEGTPIFPREPILTVRAPAIQPVPHRHQVQPDCPGGPGAAGVRVRLPPGPGGGRGPAGGPGLLYRWLCRHRLHPGRPALRLPRRGDHGPLLGADVPRRVHRL